MAMPAFSSPILRGRLNKLNNDRQLAFGALCCERLLPNYLAFQQETGWGDIVAIRNALDCIWAVLYGKELNPEEVNGLIVSCELAAPNSDSFTSLYVTLAQDACFSACALLDFLIENDVEKIVQAAIYAIDSVDLYVQESESMVPNDPQLEQKILQHWLMQRELAQQEQDMRAIEQVPFLSKEFLVQRISSWKNNGKSNLDLP